MKRLMIGILLASLVTGCSQMSHSGGGDGYINIMADAKGMQAFGDMQNGMITNGKASPDKNTAHWMTRNVQEREATRRILAPTFLDNLFGSSKTVPASAESAPESNQPTQGGSL